MNIDNVPDSVSWMIPVILEMRALADISDLSLHHRQLVSREMTSDMYTIIMDWIDSTDSPESRSFYMSMIDLGSLELFEEPTSEESYTRVFDDLDFLSSGRRRNALLSIGCDWLENLNIKELTLLKRRLESLSKDEHDRAVRLQCYWLMHMVAPGEYDFRDSIRGIADAALLDSDTLNLMWALELLLRIAPIKKTDLDRAVELLAIPEFTGNVVGPLLFSPHLSSSQKQTLAQKALSIHKVDASEVIEEWNEIKENLFEFGPFFGKAFQARGTEAGTNGFNNGN